MSTFFTTLTTMHTTTSCGVFPLHDNQIGAFHKICTLCRSGTKKLYFFHFFTFPGKGSLFSAFKKILFFLNKQIMLPS